MLAITIAAFLTLGVLYWYYRRVSLLRLFSDNGIPTPAPNFLWGNMLEYSRYGTLEFHKKLIKQHGPIVGYYLGLSPYLVVADKTLLHEILVSNSQKFLQRPRRIKNGVNPDPRRKRMLAHLPPEEWQKVRKALSGMFNPPKLRPLIPNLRESIEQRFINQIENTKTQENEVEFGSLFECLSLELIGMSAFGRREIVQGNDQDPMLRAVRDKYEHQILAPLNIISLCFPEFSFIIGRLRILYQRFKELVGFSAGHLNTTLWDVAEKCVRDGLDSPNPSYTQFQLLQKIGVDRELMAAYAVNAFTGDYENVSTTLTFLTHLLIDHPEVQEKIRQESMSVREQLNIDLDMNNSNNNNPTPESLYEYYSSLKYMEAVIYEMLRLWPQTSFVRRSPAVDYEYVNDEGKRFVIPKGVHIQVSHQSVQRDEDVWGEDSLEFKPERFLDGGDRDKVSPNCVTYQGFGSGPRHCMGQRFAGLILKMIITNLVEKYELQRCERTGDIREYHKALMNPTHSFYASIVER